MCDDPFSAQMVDNWETKIASELDHLICVSSRMAEHFVNKHGALRNEPIVCPILTDARPTQNGASAAKSRRLRIFRKRGV
jgi:hypothetical protein